MGGDETVSFRAATTRYVLLHATAGPAGFVGLREIELYGPAAGGGGGGGGSIATPTPTFPPPPGPPPTPLAPELDTGVGPRLERALPRPGVSSARLDDALPG